MDSGDLGRYDRPILKDPDPAGSADWLLLESTYGDRLHEKNAEIELRNLIKETVAAGGWALGYFGLWAAKFGLAWATLGSTALNVIRDKTLEKVAGATALGTPSPLLAIGLNLEQLAQPAWRLVLLVILGALLAWRILRLPHAPLPPTLAALAAVALLPLLWYAALANHSIVHAWFTCRVLAPTLVLLLVAATGAVPQDSRASSTGRGTG